MFFLYLRDLCNLWSNPLCLHFNFLIRVESWRRQFHADFGDRQLKAFDWKHPRLAAIQIERPEPSGIAALGEVSGHDDVGCFGVHEFWTMRLIAASTSLTRNLTALPNLM